jgi:hypothetical protein
VSRSLADFKALGRRGREGGCGQRFVLTSTLSAMHCRVLSCSLAIWGNSTYLTVLGCSAEAVHSCLLEPDIAPIWNGPCVLVA